MSSSLKGSDKTAAAMDDQARDPRKRQSDGKDLNLQAENHLLLTKIKETGTRSKRVWYKNAWIYKNRKKNWSSKRNQAKEGNKNGPSSLSSQLIKKQEIKASVVCFLQEMIQTGAQESTNRWNQIDRQTTDRKGFREGGNCREGGGKKKVKISVSSSFSAARDRKEFAFSRSPFGGLTSGAATLLHCLVPLAAFI